MAEGSGCSQGTPSQLTFVGRPLVSLLVVMCLSLVPPSLFLLRDGIVLSLGLLMSIGLSLRRMLLVALRSLVPSIVGTWSN